MKIILLALMIVHGPVFATSVFFNPIGQKKLKIVSGELGFSIKHPFRITQGKTEDITGTIFVDPEALTNGMRGELSIPITSLKTGHPDREETMHQVLGSPEQDRILYEFNRIEVQSRDLNSFRVELLGELRLRFSRHRTPVILACTLQGVGMRCMARYTLRPSLYGIVLPTLMGIGLEDFVAGSGEIVLAPGEANGVKNGS